MPAKFVSFISPASASLKSPAASTSVALPCDVSCTKGLDHEQFIYVPFSYAKNVAVNASSIIASVGAAAVYHFLNTTICRPAAQLTGKERLSDERFASNYRGRVIRGGHAAL